MNFILAILLYFITFSVYGTPDKKPIINKIVQDSPVYKAGIIEGSTILAINGKTVDEPTILICSSACKFRAKKAKAVNDKKRVLVFRKFFIFFSVNFKYWPSTYQI